MNKFSYSKRAMSLLTLFSCAAGVSSSIAAKELQCAVGMDRPPFVFGKDKRGIEIDLARRALALKGYRVSVKHVPNAKLQTQVPTGKFNCATSVSMPANREANVYYSENFVCYDNYLVTRKSQIRRKIQTVRDLKGLKIIAWQNAHNDLGDEFHQQYKPGTTENRINYRELHSQKKQHEMFFSQKMDAIIVDKTIFKYYKNLFNDKYQLASTKFKLHKSPFPGTTCFRAAFSDDEVRNDFNAGLQLLRDSGQYQQIVEQNTRI